MTTSNDGLAANPNRGLALAIAGQGTLLGAWFFGLLGSLSDSSIGLLALVALVTGLVLSIVALFMLGRRMGPLAPTAAWLMIGGVGAGLLVFVGIPGDREWGKLGALVFGMAILAGGIVLGHLVASIALIRANARVLGIIAIVLWAATLVIVIASLPSNESMMIAMGTAFAGHVCVLIGFAAMRVRA